MKKRTIMIMVSVHQRVRPFLLLIGINSLKKFMGYMDIPEKMSIKKLTNGSITNQIMENPVMYPNMMRPNRTWGPWD